MEVEAKFAVDAGAAAKLRRHPLLAHYALGRPRTRWLENVYHDTPTLDLLRQGLELRLRREGARHVQTLKAVLKAGGGLHRRHEWEGAVAKPALDLTALAGLLPAQAAATARLVHAYAARGDLAPRVTTRYRRTTWQLRSAQGDHVELALDMGEVRAGPHKIELRELELELKSGRVSALFELAALLHADIPLQPETRGKAERGFALLAELPEAPRHARPLALERHMTPTAALCAMVEECLAQVQANAAGVQRSDDAEYVHQMRVGLRRLRSALGLFKALGRPPAHVLEALRWSAEQLGQVRDAEVLALETLPRIPAPAALPAPWLALCETARAQAQQARQRAAEAVRTPRHVGWQLELMAWVQALGEADLPPTSPQAPALAGASLAGFARRELRRLRKRLVASGRGLAQADAAGRHQLRIAAKKLRYAGEMLEPQARRLRPLVQLQQQLGQLNDAEVAATALARIAAEAPPLAPAAAYAQGWLAGEAEARVQALNALWQRVRRAL